MRDASSAHGKLPDHMPVVVHAAPLSCYYCGSSWSGHLVPSGMTGQNMGSLFLGLMFTSASANDSH